MNNLIKVSVVMSVYNGEKWLESSIKSVLNQTFKDFEFIIVNDGSTDSTLKIIDYFITIDKRIKLINKKNTGLADSLNIGISLAKGNWIARIDADDLSNHTRLEKQYNLAVKEGEDTIIGSHCYLIDSNGNLISRKNYPLENKKLKYNLIQNSAFFPHSSTFFSLSLFNRLGRYRSHFKRSQDYDLWLRSISFGYRFICIDEPLVSIRKHKDQLSLTDSGFQTLIYSTCALSCFYIRSKNCIDPADKYTIDVFNYQVRNVVEDSLGSYRSLINIDFHSFSNLIKFRLKLFSVIISPVQFIFTKILHKFIQARCLNISKRLANIYIYKYKH